MTTLTFAGMIEERDNPEDDPILFLSDYDEPLAEILDESIRYKQVTARYWITYKPCTKDEAEEEFMKHLMGLAKTEYDVRYSDTTGYLWTDEECNIGGHDLIKEIRGEIGKFLILEIDVHESLTP